MQPPPTSLRPSPRRGQKGRHGDTREVLSAPGEPAPREDPASARSCLSEVYLQVHKIQVFKHFTLVSSSDRNFLSRFSVFGFPTFTGRGGDTPLKHSSSHIKSEFKKITPSFPCCYHPAEELRAGCL